MNAYVATAVGSDTEPANGKDICQLNIRLIYHGLPEATAEFGHTLYLTSQDF